MKKCRERMNLAAEILSDMKRRLITCRIALIISLAGNMDLTAGILRLKKRGK